MFILSLTRLLLEMNFKLLLNVLEPSVNAVLLLLFSFVYMDSFDIIEQVTLLTRLACGHKTCRVVHITGLVSMLDEAKRIPCRYSAVCSGWQYFLYP